MLGAVFVVLITLYGFCRLVRFYLKNFVWGHIDRNNEISVKGKTVVITGANAGIGKETAREMAERGATVVLACRNQIAANEAIVDIRQKTANGKLEFMKLNLSSLKSVRDFAKEFQQQFDKLDILICNAGVMMPIKNKSKTEDGFEIHFGVNHLGHFLLTNLLLEPIKNAAPSRIVIVSSLGHNNGEIDFEDLNSERKHYVDSLSRPPLYCNSKLANALFNKELGKRLKGTGVQTYALCPGRVLTDIAKNWRIVSLIRPMLGLLLQFFVKMPSEGAQTTLLCALSKHPDVLKKTGEFYQHCGFWDPKERIELEDDDAAKLWTISEKLVGLS